MKAYVMTTGSVFGLLVLAHVWRVIEEGPHLATDRWYVLITAVAAALCLWAWRLLRLTPRAQLVPEGAQPLDEVRRSVTGLRELQQRIGLRSKAKLSDREARSAIEEGRL